MTRKVSCGMIAIVAVATAIAQCPVPGGPFVNGNQFPGGGNANHYYWIDVAASDRDAVVKFCGDGPSHLPDPMFIAHVGKTNRVLLLIGKRYEAFSAADVRPVGASSADVALDGVGTISSEDPTRRFSVCWPVTFSLTTRFARHGGLVRREIKAKPRAVCRDESDAQRRTRLAMQREAVRSDYARRLDMRRKRGDKWKDSPENLLRHAERPQRWFLEKDATWDGREKDERGWLHNVPAVNTNAALYGFCGCMFGRRSTAYSRETYVKMETPFWGFPWIRMDPCPGYEPFARCDARMTFCAAGRSSVPVRRMKAMRDFFASKYGVEFLVQSEGDGWFRAEGLADGEYHVGVYATNYVGSASGCDSVMYEIGFEVVNELCVSGSDDERTGPGAINWHNILHVTDIGESGLDDESAWRYVVPRGASTEELLDEWIRTGDDGPLSIPGQHYKIGTPVGANSFNAYVCPEWEADSVFSTWEGCGNFIKFASRDVQQRIAAKLYNPSFFRPRKPDEKRHYTEGGYIGEIVPGDTLTWTDSDGNRRDGIVCSDDGEFVEKFGCRIKTTKVIEMARPCDYLPSQLSSNYMAAARSVRDISQRFGAQVAHSFPDPVKDAPTTTNFCRMVGEHLAKLHEQMRPGCYIQCTRSILEMPTREAARRLVKFHEEQDLVRWQLEILHCIDEALSIVRNVFRQNPADDEKAHGGRKMQILTDELCEIMGLSAYERKSAAYDCYWNGDRHAFKYAMGEPRWFHDATPPHLPAVGRPPAGYPYSDFVVSRPSDVPRVITALEAMHAKDELDFAFAVWTAAGTCMSFGMTNGEKEDAIVSFAKILAKRGTPRVCAWTTWRLAAEYGDTTILPWTFLYEVATIANSNGLVGDKPRMVMVEDSEGRSSLDRRKNSKVFIDWAARVFSSQYFRKTLEREPGTSIKSWQLKLTEAGLVPKQGAKQGGLGTDGTDIVEVEFPDEKTKEVSK